MSIQRTMKHSTTTERRWRQSPDGGFEVEELASAETIVEYEGTDRPASYAQLRAMLLKLILRSLPFCLALLL